MEEKVLQKELQLFEEHRAEWVRSHRGEFVAIIGTRVIGFYSDYESGLGAGLSAVGLGHNFLLKQVLPEDPVYSAF
jgi:hypothetical protein